MGVTFGKEQPHQLGHLSAEHSSPVVHYRGNRQPRLTDDGESCSPTAGIDYAPMLPPEFAMLMDPRSPTDGVYRTPLQVSSKQALLLDPRSPSVGVERTPIQVLDFNSKQIPCQVLPHQVGLTDPRSPLTGIDRTPIQIPAQRMVLVDPRSPSVGIDRTPIQAIDFSSKRIPCHALPHQVGLTDPRSPSIGIDRTPIQIPAQSMVLVDPRSPSVGIDRTPILTLKPQLQSVEGLVDKNCVHQDASVPMPITTELDPRSPTIGIKRTPIVLIEVENMPSPQDVPLEYDVDDVEPDEAPPSNKIPFNISAAEESTVDIASTAAATSMMNDEVPENSGSASKSGLPVLVKSKSLQDSAKQQTLGGSRSPLSPVNHTRIASRNGSDTPRGLVQRKQVLRVEKLRGSPGLKSTARLGQYQVFCDKENNP